MLANNISLRCVGEIEMLPPDVQKILKEVIQNTARDAEEKPGLILNLALSYGSRFEIVRAARIMAEKCVSGQFDPDDFSEKLFASHLYTVGLPDPDLLIRTGGESRLSNFLLWQLSYAELYITETMWPDFNNERFIEALKDFQNPYYSQRKRDHNTNIAKLTRAWHADRPRRGLIGANANSQAAFRRRRRAPARASVASVVATTTTCHATAARRRPCRPFSRRPCRAA